MPDAAKNRSWTRYVKYLYFDGKLPGDLHRKRLMRAAYELAPELKGRVVHVGPEEEDDRSYSTISLLIPGFNQVDMLFDGTGSIVAYSWPVKDGQKPRFIDCEPMTELLGQKYSQFYVAPRAELMAAITPDMLADLLPSDRKLLASLDIKTVGEALFTVVVSPE